MQDALTLVGKWFSMSPTFLTRPSLLSKPHILILSEHPPLAPQQPATGLSVRHTRMARCWADEGFAVTYAWTSDQSADIESSEPEPFERFSLAQERERVDPHEDRRAALRRWASRHPNAMFVLGYWEFEPYLPANLDGPLVLDFVAPRLLERQFEDMDRLPGDFAQLIPLLSRCDEVWVGNQPQHDLMLPLMIMAGHNTTHHSAIRIVPISAPVQAIQQEHKDRPLTLFHGGRDWPWRNSQRWLSAVREQSELNLQLIDASKASQWRGFDDYLAAFKDIDVLLELADENLERRYSQSFRATDALCRGVPIICNRFLPLAHLVEEYGAGWVIETPGELSGLLREIDQDKAMLQRASAGAVQLAQARLNQDLNYRPLGAALRSLMQQAGVIERTDLLRQSSNKPAKAPQPESKKTSRPLLHRLVHWQVNRHNQRRPKPSEAESTWVVVSRSDLFPTNHGAAVKIERTAWAMSFHVDRVLILTPERTHYWEYRQGERKRKSFPLWMRLPGWPQRVNIRRLHAIGVPDSNAFLYLPLVDRGIHLRLMWLIGRYPVESVQGDFPGYAHPAVWSNHMFKTRSFLVEHNVEYRRIAEQERDLSADAKHWLKRQEVDIANACERVITVSERDRSLLIAAGVQEDKVRTIPHGVDLQRFSQAKAIDVHDRYGISKDHKVLVFHGIYSYPPNLEAVRELSTSLLPRLEKAGVSATVLAIGPVPPKDALDGIVFAGPADDLPEHLKAGDLAVIPLRDGGGTRMKILDDFAAGVPVVTTSKGMEGIPVTHGEHLCIVDDPQAMAEAVVELLNNADQRQRLSDNAHRWVSQFDWREIARRYIEFVREPL